MLKIGAGRFPETGGMVVGDLSDIRGKYKFLARQEQKGTLLRKRMGLLPVDGRVAMP